MITLKQLAEQSGFSIRTVRRVLANQPHVNPEKRRIILELAEKNCYVPNMAARSLRLQQKNCVGVLLENFGQNASVNKLNALDAALVEKGYCPLLGRITPNQEEECEKMLATWTGIAEYVVVFPVADSTRINYFRKLSELFPLKFIFVDCNHNDLGYCVPVDRIGSVRNMVESLSEMNFKHLLYCGSLDSRKKGVATAQTSMKITTMPLNSEFADGEAVGAEVMASGADVVFFDTDRAAAGFYRYAAENNIRIPDDISIVGFDNEAYDDILTPPLASLAHPDIEIAERILQIISGDTDSCTPLKMKFVRRKSLKNIQ